MTTCTGCKQHELIGDELLCLPCVEDLQLWLRSIPALYAELDDVRLPGSVRQTGPSVRTRSTGSAAPVRLAVVDLMDRGETLARLRQAWPGMEFTVFDVEGCCHWYLTHLLEIVQHAEALELHRRIRGLVRDLGRAVGEPEDLPVGKCPQPVAGGELCRGQLLRVGGTTDVYCRRCGHRPAIVDQGVWVTPKEAHLIVGVKLETVRTWFKRGQVGWGPPMLPGLGWLPIIVRRAAATTLPQSSGMVNHGSGAEPSPSTTGTGASPLLALGSSGLGSDADVLGQETQPATVGGAPGNVTPPVGAPAGKAVAFDPTQDVGPRPELPRGGVDDERDADPSPGSGAGALTTWASPHSIRSPRTPERGDRSA